MTTALIDADIVAFRAAAKVQDKFDGELVADPRVAIREAEVIIENWVKYVKPNMIYLCFSCPTRQYFRNDIYPEYKQNRAGLEKPPALTQVTEYLKEKYKTIVYTGLEADDVMGICASDPRFYNPVIISIDKDMQTVPGKFINPDKMRRPVRNNPALADLMMFKQALTGDSTDNYKGIPGIGPKKADKILESARRTSLWTDIVQAFLDAKLTTDYALTMVRLARILRYEDYNHETGEVRLWHPTHPVWMTPSALSITSSTESKSTTSSNKSAPDSPETKPVQSQTLSSTSADIEVKTTDIPQSSISKKQGGISKNSSVALKRKRKQKETKDDNSNS
jgi:5'-3' exonuclease